MTEMIRIAVIYVMVIPAERKHSFKESYSFTGSFKSSVTSDKSNESLASAVVFIVCHVKQVWFLLPSL